MMSELIVISILTGIGLGALSMYIREVDKRLSSLIDLLFNGGEKDEDN